MLDASGNQGWTFFAFVHLCVLKELKERKSNNLVYLISPVRILSNKV